MPPNLLGLDDLRRAITYQMASAANVAEKFNASTTTIVPFPPFVLIIYYNSFELISF